MNWFPPAQSTPSDQPAATPDAQRRTEAVPPLRRILTLLRRRRWPVLVVFVMSVVAAIAYAAVKTPTYQGGAQVLLSRQNLANALTKTPDPASATNDFRNIVLTQATLARTSRVAQRVVQAVPSAGLDYKGLLGSSTVKPLQNADILLFQVRDQDRKRAALLATTYAREFVAFRRQLDTSSLETALTQLDNRLSALQTQSVKNRSLITQLIAREQELRTLTALQTSNALVASNAADAAKVGPNLRKDVILGILVGLILAVVLVYIIETFDTRIRQLDEIESRLGIPFLGALAPPSSELEGRLLMLAAPRDDQAEAFRMLRTSFQYVTLDRGIKTIMVTSSVESEGKSTTVSNLACTAARSGARVILVDLDLRRPIIDRLFDLPPGPGITDVAIGRTTLDEALVDVPLRDLKIGSSTSREDSLGSLQILRTGSVPPDPGEFVISPIVRRILGSLSERADMVFIDAPPLLRTGDAAALSSIVDALFLVTRIPVVRRPMLDAAVRALTGSRAAVLGFVVTGRLSDESSNYEYSYGYGYGPHQTSDDQNETAAEAPSESVGHR